MFIFNLFENHKLQVCGQEEQKCNLNIIHMSTKTVGDFSAQMAYNFNYTSFSCHSMGFCNTQEDFSCIFWVLVKKVWIWDYI